MIQEPSAWPDSSDFFPMKHFFPRNMWLSLPPSREAGGHVALVSFYPGDIQDTLEELVWVDLHVGYQNIYQQAVGYPG